MRVEVDATAGFAETQTEVEIFRVQKVALVHAADREVIVAAKKEASPGNRRKRGQFLRAGILVKVEAAKIRMTGRKRIKLRRLNESAPRRQRRAPRSLLFDAVGVDKLAPDHPGAFELRTVRKKARDAAALYDGVGIEKDEMCACRCFCAEIAGDGETDIAVPRYDSDWRAFAGVRCVNGGSDGAWPIAVVDENYFRDVRFRAQ